MADFFESLIAMLLSIPYVFYLWFAGWVLVGVVLVCWGYAKQKKDSHVTSGRCGGCGYITQGLSRFDCPECGADLREVGIVKQGQPNHILIAMGLKAIALALLFLMLVILLQTIRAGGVL
ncbi:hypothetical protein [Poriferisphaera sp. WC338]|uniref:hypothetical protein n=1 Tax=Poriferisphaera sp. WC338 TaxID=3425129 RepID=UPI003D813C81